MRFRDISLPTVFFICSTSLVVFGLYGIGASGRSSSVVLTSDDDHDGHDHPAKPRAQSRISSAQLIGDIKKVMDI
jgi:hypothetical protein